MEYLRAALGVRPVLHHEGQSMYEAFFQLQKRPFAATPDAACCFAPDSFQESLAELVHRVENGQDGGV